MPEMLGVLIGEKHTYKDWHLGWTGITISFPEAKTKLVDLPGGNGSIDLSTALTGGDVKYKERTISLTFSARDQDFYEWPILISEIANYLHGEKVKIVLDIDPIFYYYGRLAIDPTKTDKAESTITITGTCDPYKYELYSSLEEQPVEYMNNPNVIARNYKNINVNGTYSMNIVGRRMPVILTLECSAEMTLKHEEATYKLPKGKSIVFDIMLTEGNNNLTFEGTGTISIDYRGGEL